MKMLIARYVFAFFLVLLCSMFLTSMVREHGKDYFLSHYKYNPEEKDLKKNAERWLNAVNNSNEKKALAAAKALVPSSNEPELPELPFLRAVRVMGISTTSLTDDFNKNDFLYWKDCFQLMKLADKLKAENSVTPAKLFEFIKNYTASEKPAEKEAFFNADILNKKDLSETDKFRVLCALGRQAGYESKIIAIPQINEKTFFLCELRNGQETAVADFRNGILYNKSIQDLLTSPPANIPNIKNGIIYIQPSDFFDFRLANQKLALVLAKSGLKNLPIFGKNPEIIISDYKQKYLNEKADDIHFNYWNIPLISAKTLLSK